LDELVIEMKLFDCMHERVSLGTLVSDSLMSNDAWFNSRKIPIRHLRSSSDNSFGFSMAFCLGIFPVFVLGTSYSVFNKYSKSHGEKIEQLKKKENE
jgi:hypothetical protein